MSEWEYNLVEIKDINYDRINIKKPIKYPHDDTYIFDVYYENKFFLIPIKQVQICMKNKNIKLIDTSSCLEDLKTLVEKITYRVSSNSKYKDLFKNKEQYSMIDSNISVITFKNVCSEDTTVFDMEGQIIEINRLRKNDNVVLIVYVKNMWINDKYFGVNIKLSQIQRMEPYGLKKPLFVRKTVSIPVPTPPPAPKVIPKLQNREINKIVRPSLIDILESREKLRKTNLLS